MSSNFANGNVNNRIFASGIVNYFDCQFATSLRNFGSIFTLRCSGSRSQAPESPGSDCFGEPHKSWNSVQKVYSQSRAFSQQASARKQKLVRKNAHETRNKSQTTLILWETASKRKNWPVYFVLPRKKHLVAFILFYIHMFSCFHVFQAISFVHTNKNSLCVNQGVLHLQRNTFSEKTPLRFLTGRKWKYSLLFRETKLPEAAILFFSFWHTKWASTLKALLFQKIPCHSLKWIGTKEKLFHNSWFLMVCTNSGNCDNTESGMFCKHHCDFTQLQDHCT